MADSSIQAEIDDILNTSTALESFFEHAKSCDSGITMVLWMDYIGHSLSTTLIFNGSTKMHGEYDCEVASVEGSYLDDDDEEDAIFETGLHDEIRKSMKDIMTFDPH